MRPGAASALLLSVSLWPCLQASLRGAGDAPSAFLGSELPLKVLAVLPSTPSSAREDGSTRLSGRDALTVIFSRSVIALGSDWSPSGGMDTPTLRPFVLAECHGQPAFKVPGKFRWATTSTARFDPDVDWPSDLCFDLVVSPGLRSFDGLPVVHEGDAGPTVRRFTTEPVRIRSAYVRSERASNLTSFKWTSTIPEDDDGMMIYKHEVPPDGIVFLSFSSDLDHEVAFETLTSANRELFSAGEECRKFDRCGPRCIALRPRGLASGRTYNLTLPMGGAYGNLSGLAGARRVIKLTGLLPFEFPFWFEKPPKERWRMKRFRYRRYNMYLRHGLSTSLGVEAQLAELKKSITLESTAGRRLDFALSLVDNATLRLEAAELEPKAEYKIHATSNPAVRDGFGLQLQSSSMSFTTGDLPSRVLHPFRRSACFREFPHNLQVLVTGSNNFCERGGGGDGEKIPAEVAAWPVTRGMLKAGVAHRFNNEAAAPASAARVVASDDGAQALRSMSIDTSRLLRGPNRTGLFLHASRTACGRTEKSFVSVANFGLSLVAMAGNRLIVWATTLAEGRPVPKVLVTVFRLSSSYRPTEADTDVVGTAWTDASGIAIIAPPTAWSDEGVYRTYMATAEAPDGSIAICEDPPAPWPAPVERALMGTLVTDRAVYQPGDTVHIKGYVRARGGERVGPELLGDGSFAVGVRWGGGAKARRWDAPAEAQARLAVHVSQRHGTTSANLTVPEAVGDVGFGDIPIELLHVRADQDAEEVVATAYIVVADPRPPTVSLTLTTEAKFVQAGDEAAVDVELQTSTYSGAAVEGAEVEVLWSLRRALQHMGADLRSGGEVVGIRGLPSAVASSGAEHVWQPPGHGNANDSPQGKVVFSTGAGGKKTATLKIGELMKTAGEDGAASPPCQEGDSLEITARWVGPTREVVTARLPKGPLRVARSPYTLSIAPSRDVSASMGQPLPGTPFAVLVDVRDADGKTMPDTRVTVSMHEWNGADPVRDGTALLRPDSWGVVRGDPCVARPDGAKEAQCASTVMLPEAKKYVVLARADVFGTELVSGFMVGKTPEEWQREPLATLSDALSIGLDRDSYQVGDVARLTITSQFRDAAALIVWGNSPGARMQQRRLAGPPNTDHHVEIQIGEECRLGCQVLVMLAVPSQSEREMMPVPVPTSPFLDLTLPRSLRKSVQLHVPGPSHEYPKQDVRVAVLGSGGAAAEVLEPGSQAFVEVSLPPSEAGAEVCIFVTDRAMLDMGEPLHPHKLVELGRAFDVTRGDHFRTADTRSRLASSRGYQAFVDAALRRAALDPWAVEETWPLHPSPYSRAGAEMTDEAFFAAHTSDITIFPGQGCWSSASYAEESGNYAECLLLDAEEDSGSVSGVSQRARPVAMMARREKRAAPAPSPDAPGGGGGAPSGSVAYMRTRFEITPLFADSVIVGANGKATVAMRLPDNIATFEVRAYVVGDGSAPLFGQVATSVISRRTVSLVPSLPRIVRPGDRFECGVTVARHGQDALPAVDVAAAITSASSCAELRMSDLADYLAVAVAGSTVRAQVPRGGAEGPREVIFPFVAPTAQLGGGTGSVTLRFSASVDGRIVDALESPLRVRPSQAPVVVATSMAITASSQATTWPEGIELPEAMPGSGAVELIAGVGHLPSVAAAAADVADQDRDNGEVLASALLPAASLRPYCGEGVSGAAVPTEEEIAMARAERLFDEALKQLPAYTDSRGYPPLGLFWHRSERSASYPASVSLNAFGLLVAQLVKTLAPPDVAQGEQREAAAARPPAAGGCSAARPGARVPEELQRAWRTALVRAVEREVERKVERKVLAARQAGEPCEPGDCYLSWASLAEVRAALGPSWEPEEPEMRAEFSMEKLFSKASPASPRGLAHAALAYTLHADAAALGGDADARLDRVYGLLAGLLRVQGRTAYVAAPGSAHSAGPEANALVLLALSRAGPRARDRHFASSSGSSLLARLAAYVADGGGQSARFGGGRWASPRATALGGAALASYDSALGMTAPSMALTAASGETKLLEYEVHGVPTPPASSSTAWDVLRSPPEPVLFSVSEGQGQVSIVAALTFVPASSPTMGAVYRGLFVQKVVRKMGPSGTPVGPPLKIVKLGDSVVVTIQVTSADDVSRVTLEDFTAGGLEPVDASVAGDAAGSSASGGCGSWRGVIFWWCMPSFSRLAVRPDRVRWSSQAVLRAGTHSVSYQAIAATRGVFTLPPAQASVNNQPEVLGLSDGSGVIVVAGGNPNTARGAVSAQVVPDPTDADAVAAFLARHGVAATVESSSPRACPGGCPHGGVCQLSTGRCACYVGVRYIDGDCPEKKSTAALFAAAEADVDRSYFDNNGSSPLAAWHGITAIVAVVCLLAMSVLCIRKSHRRTHRNDYEERELIVLQRAEQNQDTSPQIAGS